MRLEHLPRIQKDPIMHPSQITPGSSLPEEINIHNQQRAGHHDRIRTIRHIMSMKNEGYITEDEANHRIRFAETTEKTADLKALTSDLPPPLNTRTWLQTYNWDNHWFPTMLTGMALSLITATIPAVVLAADHQFPSNPAALGVGVTTMIIGIIAFIGCLIVTVTEASP